MNTKTKLASELPAHKSYPRLVTVPAGHGQNLSDKPKKFVRLTCGRFISIARWNELSQQCESFAVQFNAAKAEADAKELQDRASFAQTMNSLARTEIAIDAAANGLTVEEYLIKLI